MTRASHRMPMTPNVRSVGALLMALMFCHSVAPEIATSQTRAAPTTQLDFARKLLAAASEQRVWVAVVSERAGETVTDISVRLFGVSHWHAAPLVHGRATSVAARGSQLAVLFDHGGWVLVDSTSTTVGSRAPEGAQFLALTSNGSDFFALARRFDDDGDPVVVYQLRASGWEEVHRLPPLDLAPPIRAMHIWVSGEGVFVLAVAGQGAGRYWTSANGDQWTPMDLPSDTSDVLPADAVAGVVFCLNSSGELQRVTLVNKSAAQDAKSSTRPTMKGTPQAVAAARAFGNLRVFWMEEGRVYEQVFDESLRAEGTPARVISDRVETRPGWQNVLALVLTVLMTLALLSMARSRGEIDPARLLAANVRIAGLFSRVAAATIDAFPLFVAIGVVIWRAPSDEPVSPQYLENAWPITSAGTAAYILYMTVAEVLTGRSVGKWLLGLRVVSIDAAPASTRQIVIRNLLRFIDIISSGVTLLLVIFTPLRQRAGDLVGSTMVISDVNLPAPAPPASE